MERDTLEIKSNQEDASSINSKLAHYIIGHCLLLGITEFCLCPGARNSALIDCLKERRGIQTYFFYEERNAAFFALGRIKLTGKPVVVITTSGTAVGELLPAAMEGYYSGLPLLMISADRPRAFRGSGAPQSADQVGIFGIYAHFFQDIQFGDQCYLHEWGQASPAHLNVSFEECYVHNFKGLPITNQTSLKSAEKSIQKYDYSELRLFLRHTANPIAIVSTLLEKDKYAIVEFLQKLGIPVYCEGVSGIREDERLTCLRIKCIDRLWECAETAGVAIDGILRIGGVPTCRLWRDLEYNRVKTFSVSHLPFPGLSWASVTHADLSDYFGSYPVSQHTNATHFRLLRTADSAIYGKHKEKMLAQPFSEQSLVHSISKKLPKKSLVYLGNSLPIREWDECATYEDRNFRIFASRGLNGIDGQISTFLGLCDENTSNWAIVGDLTAMYDLAAPWIVNQLPSKNINIIIINNSGGKIFSRLFKNPQIQNKHSRNFEHFAKMWGLDYTSCFEFEYIESVGPQIIEIIPKS